MKKPSARLWAVAFHEAGHAYAAVYQGIGIGRKGVSIVPDAEAGSAGAAYTLRGFRGRPDGEITPAMQRGAEKNAIVTLAGEIAQRKHNPRSVRRYHGSSDRMAVVDLMSFFTASDQELQAYIGWLQARAEDIVHDSHIHWPTITAIAEALVEHRTLTRSQVETICEQTRERLLREWLSRTKEESPKHERA